MDDAMEAPEEEDTTRIYGKPLREPVLGKHFNLPGKSAAEQRIELDTSLSYIPVFTHLKIHDADEIECPGTPPAIRRISKEEYMDFYLPSTSQTGNQSQKGVSSNNKNHNPSITQLRTSIGERRSTHLTESK